MGLINIGQFLRLIWLFWLKVHLHFKGENAVERLKNKAMFVFCGKGIAAPWYSMKWNHNHKQMFIFSEKHKCDHLGQGCYVLLVLGYWCGANIVKKFNPQNPGEPRGFGRWGPHSPGFKFFGELQTLIIPKYVKSQTSQMNQGDFATLT